MLTVGEFLDYIHDELRQGVITDDSPIYINDTYAYEEEKDPCCRQTEVDRVRVEWPLMREDLFGEWVEDKRSRKTVILDI